MLEETIISGVMGGFISKIISDGVDESWYVIKKAIEKNIDYKKNFQTQIYRIIINVLNALTYNKYKNNQDIIYQTAEKLLMGFKSVECDDDKILKSGLRTIVERVNDDTTFELKFYCIKNWLNLIMKDCIDK